LHGGNVPATRRACVGLALLLLPLSSRLPKPPLLPARPIYVLKQTLCRPPRGFVQEPVPERPQPLAVKSSSAQGPSGTGFFLNARSVLVEVDLVQADIGAAKWVAPAARSLEPRRSAVLISALATGPPAGVGGRLGPFLAA